MMRKILIPIGALALIAAGIAGWTIGAKTDPHNVHRPVLSQGGDSLIFMSDRSGDWELYRIALDGSGLARLTDRPG